MPSRTALRLWTALLLTPVLATAYGAEPRQDPLDRKPFVEPRTRPLEFPGPGRDLPSPEVAEVLIGYFGPDDPAHPRGGDMWRAAQWAVEEANRRGGYRGKPYRLVSGWAENPWGTGVAKVTRMVFDDNVWAIVGGIDGPSTHLAEQVVAKAHLTLVSPASTDKTVNLANVPWMFSCLPGDHLVAGRLAEEINTRSGKRALVLLSANDHDSHLFAVELKKCLAKRRVVPRYHFEYPRAAADVGQLAAQVVRSKAEVAILIAGADDGARLIKALRKGGFTGPVFGGPWMGRRQFVETAGEAATGVVFPLLYQRTAERQSFERRFQERFGSPPDYAAVSTYDSVRLLIAAIEKAGLNRARIRDAVRDLSPWSGIAGTVKWDAVGSNTRAVRLGTISNGRVLPFPVPVGQGLP